MIYFGFDEVIYGWPRYFDLCNSFEVRCAPAPEDDPNIETLNRWRVDSPRGFAWIMHTPHQMARELVDAFERGDSTLPPRVDALIEETEQRAHAIAAKAIILETPPDLPPSDVSRSLIKDFGAKMSAQTKRVLLWESSGLWTTEDGAAVASAAGLCHVVDPFLLEAEHGIVTAAPVAAYRLTERAAARRQFDGWEMEKLIGWANLSERAFVLLAGRFKIPHAKELSLLLRE